MPLTLQVNGDIEERIEALVSGMCWAEELNTSLEVYWWFLFPHIQCPFERCFSREKLPSWVIVRGGMVESAVSIQTQADFIKKGYPTIIKSKSRFYEKDSEKWLSYLRLLSPSSGIKQRMNSIPTKNSIGIYVQNQREPPVALILAEVWKHHRGPTYFILSTDCNETKRFLQLMFKEQLFDMLRTSNPVNENYFYNRILDFFCFSQCSAILDCSRSGLMSLAAEYGGIPFTSL
jgi:hypothetical protein